MDEDKLHTALNKGLAVFFGKLHMRIDTMENKLDGKADREQIDRLQTTMDGFAKCVDTDEVERAAISRQLIRHNTGLANSQITRKRC